jgi:hypothetical protein
MIGNENKDILESSGGKVLMTRLPYAPCISISMAKTTVAKTDWNKKVRPKKSVGPGLRPYISVSLYLLNKFCQTPQIRDFFALCFSQLLECRVVCSLQIASKCHRSARHHSIEVILCYMG